jgi:hypothetical protein
MARGAVAPEAHATGVALTGHETPFNLSVRNGLLTVNEARLSAFYVCKVSGRV